MYIYTSTSTNSHHALPSCARHQSCFLHQSGGFQNQMDFVGDLGRCE